MPAGILILVPFFSVLFIAARNIFLMKRYKMYDYIFDKAIIISLLLLAFYHLFDMTYFDGRISLVFWLLLAGLKCIIDENKLIKYE